MYKFLFVADRRGKIRHYDAEGVEISEKKYQQAVKAHAAAARFQAPRPHIPSFNVAEKKSQLPPQIPPSTNAFFQQQPQPQPAMNFAQMTQNLAQQSSMFPNAEQFQYEQQPGPNSLSKSYFTSLCSWKGLMKIKKVLDFLWYF